MDTTSAEVSCSATAFVCSSMAASIPVGRWERVQLRSTCFANLEGEEREGGAGGLNSTALETNRRVNPLVNRIRPYGASLSRTGQPNQFEVQRIHLIVIVTTPGPAVAHSPTTTNRLHCNSTEYSKGMLAFIFRTIQFQYSQFMF